MLKWLKICSQVQTVALEAITKATPDQASLSMPFSDLMMAGDDGVVKGEDKGRTVDCEHGSRPK